ncbi:MAG TPA: Gfo/Idh/MocA family oxidoreductase [Acidimicrobiales bacterium]|nr:Gfo/Idh/MocA family oxidoreductase [Acidimicrobiales bacterium]
MKFGLVGTGYWARVTHGAVLADHPGVELAGVWGRDPQKAAEVAAELGTVPYPDFGDLLGQCDAVSFAVAPDVQGRLGIEAARAGKHLLLDKPLCMSVDDADQLVAEVERSRVASVVFFTLRFSQAGRDWVTAARDGDWQGGWARFLVLALTPDSPYSGSLWRRERGAIWDVGPHALSVLIGGLGPIVTVAATGGEGDLVHLVLRHASGATSTATLTLAAPKAAINVEMALWGPKGVTMLPRDSSDPKIAFRAALGDLLHNVESGEVEHPCDVHFGADVVRVLADAEAQAARSRSLPAR